MTRRSIALKFPGSHRFDLDARLEFPTAEPIAFALFAHCFTCTKDIFPVARISRALAERGIAVLRFDFTGLGGSEGDFAATTFSSNIDDLVAAAEFLDREYAAPALLIGHSFGGTAVLAAAARIASVAAVCTINAPCEPAHVRHHFGDAEHAIREAGAAEVEIAGRPFTLRRAFVDDLDRHDIIDAISKLRSALLVLHAPADAIVGVEHGHRIFAAAEHPKAFVALDGSDHLLTRRADAAYAAATIALWAARYVPHRGAEEAEEEVLPSGTVVVRESDKGRYVQDMRAGRHRLTADEPADHGGDDAGPSPYEYLLMALGACTSMTLRMYAERKEWPLAAVDVRLTHGRIHAADCADCETASGEVDHIQREITLEGDLDAKQRERLLEIANKCPVHRTLTSEVSIRSALRESGTLGEAKTPTR